MKRTVVLRVRDATTRADLQGVTARAAHTLWMSGGWGQAGGDADLAGSGDSPLPLKRQLGPDEWLPLVVAAPGYAPGLIAIDTSDDPEVGVELSPPGSVEIAIPGASRSRALDLELAWNAAARMGDARATPFATIEVAGRSTLRFGGLAPGEWEARLYETREGVPFVAATAGFRIESKETARATIAAPAELVLPTVPVRGHVTIGRTWGALGEGDGPRARLECVELDPALHAAALPRPIERPLAATELTNRFAFDFGPRWPGEYRLHVTHVAASERVVVAVGRDGSQELMIADPAEVEVTLRLAGCTRPLDRARLQWELAPTEKDETKDIFRLGRGEGLVADPATGRFRFVAPAGRVRLAALPHFEEPRGDAIQRYVLGSAIYDLRPGRNELTWELEPTCSGFLQLRHGPRDVPCSSSVRVSVKKAGDDVKFERSVTASGALAVQVSAAGRFVVTIESIQGFRDPPSIELDLSVGRVKTVVVQLERGAGSIQ